MNRTRPASLFVFVGILLLVLSAHLSDALLSQWRDMSGAAALGKLSATVDRSADPGGSAQLTIREAEKLAEKWGRPTAYSARTVSVVSTGDKGKSVEADMTGVGGRYDDFRNIRLQKGSLIAAGSIEEHSRVALVSASLADKLFASRDVVGMELRLLEATFKIVGVYDEPASLLHAMTDNGRPDVLLPVTTLLELDASLLVSTIELAAGPAAAITGEADVRAALSAIGKAPSKYRIVNYAEAYEWVGQRPKLLLAALGVLGLWRCAVLAAGRVRHSISLVRGGLSREDWPDVIRRFARPLAADAAALIVLFACAVVLAAAIRHRFYVPVRLIPDELIDWSFYRDLLLQRWQRQVGTMGYVASPGELLYERVDLLVTRLTLAGLLGGLPLFRIGIREWKLRGLSLDAQVVRLAACMCAAAAIADAIAWLAGAYYAVRPQELLVVGCLTVLSAIGASTPKQPTDREAVSEMDGIMERG